MKATSVLMPCVTMWSHSKLASSSGSTDTKHVIHLPPARNEQAVHPPSGESEGAEVSEAIGCECKELAAGCCMHASWMAACAEPTLARRRACSPCSLQSAADRGLNTSAVHTTPAPQP